MANVLYYLDEEKIAQEARYDGFYAVCTDLFEDSPEDILKVSEGRWQIEACFRIMKTDFAARPVYLHRSEKNSCPFSHFVSYHCWFTAYWKKSKQKLYLRGYFAYLRCKTLNLQMYRAKGFIPIYESTF